MSASQAEEEEGLEKESDPLVEKAEGTSPTSPTRLPARALRSWQPNAWTLTTLLLVGVLLGYIVRDVSWRNSAAVTRYSYETGFKTEFAPARESIRLKKVKFYGGLYFNRNGTLAATRNPDEPAYVGLPSKEMDDAWQALIHDRYLAVTPDEAKQVGDEVYLDPSRGYHSVGVDVLHSLHCLNVIRMYQDVEHYVSRGWLREELSRLHIDHCINHIRQIIQCHGDLTPLPKVWVEVEGAKNGGRKIPDFDQEHTCRDFTTIREWSTRKDQSGKRKARGSGQV